jgi:PAS domain S-box-containing protein
MNPLLTKLLAPRRMEYIALDKNLFILETSWGVRRFADHTEDIKQGDNALNFFPELIGLEPELQQIFNGEKENFELKTIYRDSKNKKNPIYFDIYIIADPDQVTQENRLIVVFEDVTENMLIQQELVQRTNEASLLLNNLTSAKEYIDKIITAMADALIVTDNLGNIKSINTAAEILFGYSKEELINQSISLVLFSEKMILPVGDFKNTTGSLFTDLELTCQKKNGDKICVSFSCALVTTENVDEYELVYIGRNISDRKQIEQEKEQLLKREKKARTEAEASEKRFRFLAESIPQQVWTAKSTGEIDYVNYNMLNYFGIKSSKILGWEWLKNVHKDDIYRAKKEWEKCLKTGKNYQMELRLKQGKTGNYRWHLTRALPLLDSAGKIVNWFGTNTDIEKQKNTEEELKNSEAAIKDLYKVTSAHNITFQKRLHKLFLLGKKKFSLDMAIFLHWQNGNFHILGKQLQQGLIINNNFLEEVSKNTNFFYQTLIQKEPLILNNVRENISENSQFDQTTKIGFYLGVKVVVKGDNYGVLAFFSITPQPQDFTGGDKNFLKLMAQWLGTEIEKQLDEKEIIKALEKEKELNELKSRFMSMASHEFRTPLSGILASAELLQRYYERLTPEKRIIRFEKIIKEVKNMTQLLDDVLLIGKSQTGYLSCQPVALNLYEFCRDLLEDIQISIGAKHSFEFNYNHTDMISFLDQKLLEQILNNLISNAIKYSSENSTITLKLIYDHEQVTIQVKDQGIGIPEADQSNLFNPFYRGENVNNIPGTGLGLAILKNAVQLQGGEINFTSKVGVGTTFTVKLPNQNKLSSQL